MDRPVRLVPPPPTVPDPVNAPPHYRSHPSGIECITIAEHFDFNRGNVIKYTWRAGEKNDELEDLKKARFYVDRAIAKLERERAIAALEQLEAQERDTP